MSALEPKSGKYVAKISTEGQMRTILEFHQISDAIRSCLAQINVGERADIYFGGKLVWSKRHDQFGARPHHTV